MQLQERSLPINNSTRQTLMPELGEECSRVLELMHQLQVTNSGDKFARRPKSGHFGRGIGLGASFAYPL